MVLIETFSLVIESQFLLPYLCFCYMGDGKLHCQHLNYYDVYFVVATTQEGP